MLARILEQLQYCPPASEASGEVVNFTERKNPHTPVYGVKEFFGLSVTNFDPNYQLIDVCCFTLNKFKTLFFKIW